MKIACDVSKLLHRLLQLLHGYLQLIQLCIAERTLLSQNQLLDFNDAAKIAHFKKFVVMADYESRELYQLLTILASDRLAKIWVEDGLLDII